MVGPTEAEKGQSRIISVIFHSQGSHHGVNDRHDLPVTSYDHTWTGRPAFTHRCLMTIVCRKQKQKKKKNPPPKKKKKKKKKKKHKKKNRKAYCFSALKHLPFPHAFDTFVFIDLAS
jgi:hypothetical protein